MENDSAQRIADEIARLPRLEAKRVLEVGCGAGRISSLLIDRVGSLTAIDPDPEDVRWAAETIPGGVFRVGSGENLAYPDGRFDVVAFTLSLHHQDSAKALREAARVVPAGGEVVVVEPVVGGELETIFSVVHDENQAKRLAMRAIGESGLRVVGEREFSAEWRFADENDLHRTVFEYYDAPFDRKKADRMDDLIGAKRGGRPIVLQDRMVIQVLTVD